jgi:hypothetical protein
MERGSYFIKEGLVPLLDAPKVGELKRGFASLIKYNSPSPY